MTWKGVIIEESIENRKAFKMVRIIKKKQSKLENEESKGLLTFYLFEVDDSKKDEFVNIVKNSIKQSWYVHICKDKTMIVVFKDNIFEFTKLQKNKLGEAVKYGLSIGILKEQMSFEHLIDNPWD